MAQLDQQGEQANVNVTLPSLEAALGRLAGKELPCFLCGAGLPILASKRKKPYLTCNGCGVQIFVRGKSGIARLHELARLGILVSVAKESAMHGINLYNRLEQLKIQKRDLAIKRGIFFWNSDVENAIRIIDTEIEKVQGELEEIAHRVESDK
jgi:DNA-directed RNA polymerase subunit RPC12/RpoP